MYFLKSLEYVKIISKQTEKCLSSQILVNKLKFMNLFNL